MTQRWDQARSASRRPLPKPRKLHGPVGVPGTTLMEQQPPYTMTGRCLGRFMNDLTCADCNYHVCSCRPPSLPTEHEYGLYDLLLQRYGQAILISHTESCMCPSCMPRS
jgi:hypothetical protein